MSGRPWWGGPRRPPTLRGPRLGPAMFRATFDSLGLASSVPSELHLYQELAWQGPIIITSEITLATRIRRAAAVLRGVADRVALTPKDIECSCPVLLLREQVVCVEGRHDEDANARFGQRCRQSGDDAHDRKRHGSGHSQATPIALTVDPFRDRILAANDREFVGSASDRRELAVGSPGWNPVIWAHFAHPKILGEHAERAAGNEFPHLASSPIDGAHRPRIGDRLAPEIQF